MMGGIVTPGFNEMTGADAAGKAGTAGATGAAGTEAPKWGIGAGIGPSGATGTWKVSEPTG